MSQTHRDAIMSVPLRQQEADASFLDERSLTRRSFLATTLGLSAVGALLAGCEGGSSRTFVLARPFLS